MPSPFLLLLLLLLNHASAASSSNHNDDAAYDDRWLCCPSNQEHDHTECHCSDKMTHFPGWTHRQPLPSPWYSGFLEYELEGRVIHTHYVLVLAEDTDIASAKNDKPLLYWSNGGPGASSLFGLLAELGPLLLSETSTQTQEYRDTGIPTPQYNPYSWTKLGHVLLFDQPAPVGFSYCEMPNVTSAPSAMRENQDQENKDSDNNKQNNDDHDDPPVVDCAGLGWTDELAARNAYLALQTFYTKYPAFLKRDLYLTGESYAGIYIPTLARTILANKENDDKADSNHGNENKDDDDDSLPTDIPLQGFAVGDGCLGTETGICQILDDDNGTAFDFWLILFLAGHGQIPLHTFSLVMKACKPYDGHKYVDSDICKAAVKKVHEQAGFVYAYALYDDCTYSNGMSMRHRMRQAKRRQEFLKHNKQSSSLSSSEATLDASGEGEQLSGALNDYPCGGDLVMEEYLKLDVVREAFHVQESDYFSADNANGFDYTPTEKDLTGFYADVARSTNLSVLVYNGDTDPAITSFATQNWTSHLGLHVEQDWRPWTVDGCRRMGGYVTRYEGALDFLTIRGAGHLVPTYKAEATFVFLSSWLRGKDYPVYVPNCTSPDQFLVAAAAASPQVAASQQMEEAEEEEKSTEAEQKSYVRVAA